MKILKVSIYLLLFLTIGTTSYYTHRLWVFAGKISHGFDYVNAAIDCLIQENGQNESDIYHIYKRHKIPNLMNHMAYNDQIPECHIYYSQYRCWELDPKDPKSLDGCGEHFGLTKEEINTMKKDPSKIDTTMDKMWKRKKEKYEKK